MKTNCPDCGQPVCYPMDDAGMEADCPGCGLAFLLPLPPAEPYREPPAEKPPNPHRRLTNAASAFNSRTRYHFFLGNCLAFRLVAVLVAVF